MPAVKTVAKPLIALVEDEAILSELIQEELERRDFTVCVAANGKEGWELIQKEKPDLVLLDLLMPQMSGYDVLTHLRAHVALKGIPVIVISNSGQAGDLNRAFACGADDVLIKADFNPDQVVNKVVDLLKRKKEFSNGL